MLGGIVLGPTVLGHIPHFTSTLFPAGSMPTLNMVANLGLVLFLFLVGLEVDLRVFGSNWKVALSVGALGMTLPFGLGVAVAWGLYKQFGSDPGTIPVSFGVFALFIGVAMAITAFPVLARILTELNLLQTPVGVIVLSAGVGNDVVGWVLLALTVALVNAGSGLSALYVLLVCIGWVLLHVFVFRRILRWVVRKTGSDSNGPTQPVVAFVLLLVLMSAFFTGIIGVHPIFGGFLVGLICPHENGFKSKMTEKIEDLVTVLFLPIYFALSGLKTNIGLLNDGITWGYVVAVLAIAFLGKIGGGTIAARCSKLLWRESFTIGVLMSCKGLVELIVLNIGLSAGIISTRVFTIFVVMALITTFATTPVTTFLYPKEYQDKLVSWREGKINWDGSPTSPSETPPEPDRINEEKMHVSEVRKLMVYLRLDSLPAIFTFIGLLGHTDDSLPAARHIQKDSAITSSAEYQKERTQALINRKRPLEVHGVRLLELSERISTVMKDLESSEYPNRDPVINVFRSFSLMNSIAVSAGVAVTNQASYAETLQNQAKIQHSDLLLIPWSETGNLTEEDNNGAMASREARFAGANHNNFIAQTMNSTFRHACDTAVFMNRGLGGADNSTPDRLRKSLPRATSSLSLVSQHQGQPTVLPSADRSHHIFFPYFGGPDDRCALRFVVQLAANPLVTATIVNYDPAQTIVEIRSEEDLASTPTPTSAEPLKSPGARSTMHELPTISTGPQMHPRTHTATDSALDDTAYFLLLTSSMSDSTLARVLVLDESRSANGSQSTYQAALERAAADNAAFRHNAGNIVVLGRNRELAAGIESGLHVGGSGSDVALSGAGVGAGAANGAVGVAGATTTGVAEENTHAQHVSHGTELLRRTVGPMAQVLMLAEDAASVLVFRAGVGSAGARRGGGGGEKRREMYQAL